MNSASQKVPIARPEFVYLGGHPAIDFVNTLVMLNDQPTDLLSDWSDVVLWLSQVGLANESQLQIATRSGGSEALANVVSLRQTWKAEVETMVSGGVASEQFVETLNLLLSKDSFTELLESKDKSLRLSRSPIRLAGSSLALVLLARQISLFLTEAKMEYLHRCANTKSCVLYFYDTTKNHRRQWCSVDACGNRHKVAEFRRRQAKKHGSKADA